MSKFVIACPVCHQYVQASTGLFAAASVARAAISLMSKPKG